MSLKAMMCKYFGDADNGDDVSLLDVLIPLMVGGGGISTYAYGGYRVYNDIVGTPCHIPENIIFAAPGYAAEILFVVTTTLLMAGGVVYGGAGVLWIITRVIGKCDSIKVIRCKRRD